jgi:hypothetical protein
MSPSVFSPTLISEASETPRTIARSPMFNVGLMVPASIGSRGYSDFKAALKQSQKAMILLRATSTKKAVLT